MVCDLFQEYHKQSITEQISADNPVLQKLQQQKSQFDAEITLNSIIGNNPFQPEQKNALIAAIQIGIPHELLKKSITLIQQKRSMTSYKYIRPMICKNTIFFGFTSA